MKLKLIPHSREELGEDKCKNEYITTKKQYLVKIYGEWHAGRFSKQWYGWSFDNWGNAGIQLNHIEEVYEIE